LTVFALVGLELMLAQYLQLVLGDSPTYRDDLDSRPSSDHRPRAEYIQQFFGVLDDRFGGPLTWLGAQGWDKDDTRALRARLRD
ncbi:protein-tyrosine-phosphatase, partial [Streptosporangium algeriense]